MNRLDITTGQNLAKLRHAFGYTQGQLGEFLGISQPAYRKYESGETSVSREALEKLAALYYVDEYDLMSEDPSALEPALVFAFRGQADMEAVSEFHTIVKNYISMCNELGKED